MYLRTANNYAYYNYMVTRQQKAVIILVYMLNTIPILRTRDVRASNAKRSFYRIKEINANTFEIF